MDKSTQLFIRACKSNNAKDRLNKIYCKFYVGDLECINTNKHFITYILSQIVDEFNPYTSYELYKKLHDTMGFFKDERSMEDKMYDTMVTRIGLTESSKFIGLLTPARFRRNN